MDGKLLDVLIARTQTRETSTLAISMIAASTSLILLAFVCQPNGEQQNLLAGVGILYPILGMSFREIAMRTMQNHDWKHIRKHFSAEDEKIILGGFNKASRRIIFYVLFAGFPILLWCLVLANKIC